jgi:hypothetical protein
VKIRLRFVHTVGRVVTTVRRHVCSREKSSKGAAKSSDNAARGTGAKMQRPSAMEEAALCCTQASFFFVRSHPEQVASTPCAFLLADRRAHAWYIQFMAWWHCHCAFPLSLVVQLSLLPRKPSNVRSCGILMMYRLPARLSLIVVRRMSFVDQYFLGASGCRGVVRCLHMAWAWPAPGLNRGRAGDAAEASIGRALPALLGAHVLHVLRGALF